MLHENCCFVTLTYSDEHLPNAGALHKKDLQLFLKKVRKSIDPVRVRYFAVGEYGEKSHRPHYHLSLFGMSGSQIFDVRGEALTGTSVLEKAWDKGFVYVGEFNEASAQYVSRYVVKHLSDRKSGAAALFPVPEFATMSLKPGLGAGAMEIVAATLIQTVQSWESGDVVHALKIGRRKIPLGRYLLSTLRNRVGFTDEYISQIKEEATFQQSLDMLAVFVNTPSALTVTDAYKKEVSQKIKQVETRYSIWNSKHKTKDQL